MRHSLCVDCGVDTQPAGRPSEYYMLESETWQETGLGDDDGMLCIGCVEQRLGRELSRDDFSEAPINDFLVFAHSARLVDRMTRG